MIETSTSVKNIDLKVFAIQAAAPVIKKEADNPYFKSKYAEYPEIQAAIKPLIQEQGLLLMFLPVSDNKLTMYVKDTTSNEFYKCTSDLNMTAVSPQAQGSAITYLKRYMLTAFFDLQIEDAMDDDGNAGSNKQPQQPGGKQPAAPPIPENLNWLDPNTDDWFKAKGLIFNKNKSIDDIRKSYKVNKANAAVLIKKEELKPGTAYWNMSVKYLTKKDAKIANILTMFELTESDQQDLAIDAENLLKETPQTNNTTK